MDESSTLMVVKQISDQILTDPRIKGSVIDVGFSRGIVLLTGTVKSTQAARAAEEIALQQPGVLSVTNELKVG